MNICTIIAKNYLAHARTLSASFKEHHPDGECFVLVIDETAGYIDGAQEPFILLRPSQIGLEDWDEMRGAYDVLELSTAVKPWLLRHLLREHDDGTGVAYMDPDIRVLSRMVELEETLQRHSTVLTPHVTEGMPRDGKKPSETDILLAGVYNLGFIGLSRSDPAFALLDWWSERLLTDCHVAPDKGMFVDQRWVDFVPGLVADLDIFRDTAYNVAYWNLPERPLSRALDGRVLANGRPIRFFHFSGYSPDARETLSKHQTRVLITEDEVLRDLCFAYADALEANGFDEVRGFPYDHDILPSGTRLTKLMRTLYRVGIEAEELPETLFTSAGEAEFMAWLNEPVPATPSLTRFLHAVWDQRVDLQRAYPDPGGVDRDGYTGWCAVHGREQIGIPGALLARTPLEADAPVEPTAAGPRDAATVQGGTSILTSGVNVAGYLRSELGIGEVARQLMSALDAAGVPALPVGLHTPGSRQNHGYVAGGHERNPFPINLVCVNADGLPAFAEEAGPAFFEDKYTIGVWWWETSTFPEAYMGAFDHVDEVWVGTRFVADTLSAVAPVPVVHVPVAVDFPHPPAFDAGEIGIRAGFRFLFSYDYNSVLERKNPLGLIDAYKRAFGPDDGAVLVLKSINGSSWPSEHRQVRAAGAGRDDIKIIDFYLDPGDKDRLMASCDCYVSLHRSEGFGLTMAEAMHLGKPVIATGYSGNTDFMTPENSFLVAFDLVAIGENAGPYPSSGQWAQPDLDDAARQMRLVREAPELAVERGTRAAADIRAHHAPAVVGQAVKRRLDRIAARTPPAPRPTEAPRPASAAQERVRRLVARGGSPAAPSRFGKGGAAARKFALRAMKPYSAYQGEVNQALEDAVVERERNIQRLAAEQRAAARHTEERLIETSAALMAELRRQHARLSTQAAMIHTEQKRLTTFAENQSERIIGPERLVAETKALPYMSSDVFTIFESGVAGRVFGYDAFEATGGDDAYRAFEDLFRGSETFIADRQKRYLDIIDTSGPIVDVGCGRGEFLDVLRDAGIEAVGVDADAGMVARCHAKGHTSAVHADGLRYLEGREDASLGLVFCAQVVEHLPPEALQEFLALAAAKLRPGGLLIAETVNPHSVPALKAFWVDITHQHPLFPETMLALCRIAGFERAYVFHPNGSGDVEADRFSTGEYAVVARR